MVANTAARPKVTTQAAYQAHLEKLKGEIEKKNKKSVEKLYEEKRKRLWDAMMMREPDRVPIVLGSTFFPCKYVGLPYSSAYYEPIAWKAAYMQFIADFDPDTWGSNAAQSGPALDILQAKNILWPGGTLPPDVPQQNVDDEYMKEDEYDNFLDDFSDFYVRRYLPRIYCALAPIAKLPPLGDRGGGMGFQALLSSFNTPEFEAVGKAMKDAGREQTKFRETMGDLNKDMAVLGLPPLSDGFGGGPGGPAFDRKANNYRGWKGIITDMYRRPEKLIAAMEKLSKGGMSRITPADPTKKGPQFNGGGAIHRGSARLLSQKQR